jgi:hypothetical protein
MVRWGVKETRTTPLGLTWLFNMSLLLFCFVCGVFETCQIFSFHHEARSSLSGVECAVTFGLDACFADPMGDSDPVTRARSPTIVLPDPFGLGLDGRERLFLILNNNK